MNSNEILYKFSNLSQQLKIIFTYQYIFYTEYYAARHCRVGYIAKEDEKKIHKVYKLSVDNKQ